MSSSDDIIQQIRRSYLASFLKVSGFVIAIVLVAGFVFGRWDYFLIGFFFLMIGAAQVFIGQYIPLRNKHDSLLNKYGDVYLEEVSKAIARYGVNTLTSTRWFATYAEEYCEQSKLGGEK